MEVYESFKEGSYKNNKWIEPEWLNQIEQSYIWEIKGDYEDFLYIKDAKT